jgi:hypothetical protein
MTRLDRALLCALAVLVAVAFWRASARFVDDLSVPAAAAAKAIPAARSEPGPGPPPAGWTRPLFAPAVGSEPTAEARSTRPAPDDEIPRLIGVAQDRDHRVALLAHNSAVLRVRQGEKIGKWTVTQIAVRSAVVRADGESQSLRLDP